MNQFQFSEKYQHEDPPIAEEFNYHTISLEIEEKDKLKIEKNFDHQQFQKYLENYPINQGCFPSDSLLTLSDYSQISIQYAQKGMQVLTYNTESQKLEPGQITEVYTFYADLLMKIETKNNICIKSTTNHPYFICDKYNIEGEFKSYDKREMKIGDFLLNQSIELNEIVQIQLEQGQQKFEVYHISVNNNHNFFIGGILVHNMQIFLKIQNSKQIVLNVDSLDSVQDLKNKIQELQGIPADQQTIAFFGGKELESCKKLDDYKIQNASTLALKTKLKGGLRGGNVQILISSNLGHDIDSSYSDFVLVKELYEQISEQIGLNANQFILTFENSLQILEKDKFIYEYQYIRNLTKGHTAYLKLFEIIPRGQYFFDSSIMLSNGQQKQIQELSHQDQILAFDWKSKKLKSSQIIRVLPSNEQNLFFVIKTKSAQIQICSNQLVYDPFNCNHKTPYKGWDSKYEQLKVADFVMVNKSNQEQIIDIQISHSEKNKKMFFLFTENDFDLIFIDNILVNNEKSILINSKYINNQISAPVNLQTQIKELKIFINSKLQQNNNEIIIIENQSNNLNDEQQIFNQNDSINITNLKYYYQKEKYQWDLDKKSKNSINVQLGWNKLKQYKFNLQDNPNVHTLIKNLSQYEGIDQNLIIIIYQQNVYSLFDKDFSFQLAEEYAVALNSQTCGEILRFQHQITTNNMKSISDLLYSLNAFTIEKDVAQTLQQIKQIKNQSDYFQKYGNLEVYEIIAIQLWTGNKIYSQINQDLGKGVYKKWSLYWNAFYKGLMKLDYFKGVVFRGFGSLENKYFDLYKIGRVVTWKQLSGLSKDRKVAENFSSAQGVIFEVTVTSAKQIHNISQYPDEQEVIMLPYSIFQVWKIDKQQNEPIVIWLSEIPIARKQKIIIWVDDNPENNYQIAQQIEQKQDVQFVFCTSTYDAINVILNFQWLLLLQNSDFRIVSDMVRFEKLTTFGELIENHYAGVELAKQLKQLKLEFQLLIYCNDVKRAQQNFIEKNVAGYQKITNEMAGLIDFISYN